MSMLDMTQAMGGDDSDKGSMCTRKALWAIVWGLSAISIAAVCLDDRYLEPEMGDAVIFGALFFLPMLAITASYAYRYYIGANWKVHRRRGSSDSWSLALFVLGFVCPPAWLLNVLLFSTRPYQRTKFWVAASFIMFIIALVVFVVWLIP
eukprot:TRINITY_DN4706_c0_g1_i1.p1 TRINITY_DN4706_c0_g1~~TRINITY_DN4706_c0_g1_i1.p1  ORF type:complete len:150 (+),score=49.90 TRINITY_DN4706_c0_g1_i1:288-737(+)